MPSIYMRWGNKHVSLSFFQPFNENLREEPVTWHLYELRRWPGQEILENFEAHSHYKLIKKEWNAVESYDKSKLKWSSSGPFLIWRHSVALGLIMWTFFFTNSQLNKSVDLLRNTDRPNFLPKRHLTSSAWSLLVLLHIFFSFRSSRNLHTLKQRFRMFKNVDEFDSGRRCACDKSPRQTP